MNIKGVEIKIVVAVPLEGAGRQVLDNALSKNADIYRNEKNLRYFCSGVLKKAKKQRLRCVEFFAKEGMAKVFPVVATAKILAQEIYRHIKEDKPSLKKITIAISGKKVFEIFENTVRAYLAHLVGVLSQGPFLTVDTIIEVKGGIVLIKRSNPPFGWALPGGFVDYGESLEAAARREAYEETGLSVKRLRQMRTYSEPGRDPRFQTVSTVFICQAQGLPCAASDAQEAGVFTPSSWPQLHLAFDHKKVLADYLKLKKA